MMNKRSSDKRGYDDKGWLQSYHSFSFDTYYEPENRGYYALRVINEETLKGGKGFGSREHKEMEIATYVMEGVLEHTDGLGNSAVIRPGELHLISSGTGMVHSEYNLSHELPAHFLQLWFTPGQHNLEPCCAKKQFSSAAKWGQWCLLMSNNGREGSIKIHQDVDLYSAILDQGVEIVFDALSDRHYWIQVLSGSFTIGAIELEKGDALAIEQEATIIVQCRSPGEILLIDLA